MSDYKGCPRCLHYRFDGTCKAYPDRIPLPIASAQVEHTKPLFGQTNDIIFELRDPDVDVSALIQARRREYDRNQGSS